MSSLEKCLFRSFAHLKKIFVLIYRRCLYILEINPLSVASFANIFSHSMCCLSISFSVSFAMHKLLSLIRSHLVIFAFIVTTLDDGSEKILLQFMSECLAYVFL